MPPAPEVRRNRLPIVLLALLLLSACNGSPFYREGLDAMAAGNKEQGIAALEKASRENPRDAEKRAALIRNKGETIDGYLIEGDRARSAGQLDAAETAYRKTLAIDPRNVRASQGLELLTASRHSQAQLQQAEQLLKRSDLFGAERIVRTVRAHDPQNAQARRLQQQIDAQRASESNAVANPTIKAALAKPVALEFRDATLKSVFEVLSRSSGLNFVFDKDVKGDTKVTFFVRNSPLEDIIRLILTTNQLERRLLNENSFLIYPNTAAKAKEYQELVTRSFYLTNANVKQAQALVKTVAKSKDVFADEKLNLLIVKDTPDAIRLIERLIDSLDLAEPEVMLEVEVLEVTRSRLNELGVDWPDSVGYGQLQSQATTTTIVNGVTQSVTTPGGALASGYVDLRNRGSLTTFVANPALTLNLKGQNADTNVLANPRIRVKNNEKAKIHIGEKLPVFTTTSTANVGVSSSVSYLDIGLKLDVESNVALDDEVSIKVGLEVSNVVKEVTGPSSTLAYQVGTRSASTVLRLKNGETQVLAGLISDEDRKSTNHIPGIGEVPGLGRLFGSQKDTSVKTEIILLITPRVLRNINRPDFAQPALPAGTESAVGAAPLVVKPGGARSLGMSSKGGASAPVPAQPKAARSALAEDAPQGEQEKQDNPDNPDNEPPETAPAGTAASPAAAGSASSAGPAGIAAAPQVFGGAVNNAAAPAAAQPAAAAAVSPPDAPAAR